MPREALRETVTRLHREIDAGAPLSAEQRERLSSALSEVEAVLAAEGGSGESSLLARLREAEAEFEQSHPNLTLAVGAVADALSKLGI